MRGGEPDLGDTASGPGLTKAFFGVLPRLIGFSFNGLLVYTLWTWGWDLFLRPLLEIDEFMPEAVHRAGDVLSRVGAAGHLARVAWRV